MWYSMILLATTRPLSIPAVLTEASAALAAVMYLTGLLQST